MTATSACRIELEALRERLSGIIHELKNAERMIEAFDVPTPDAPPASLMDVMVDEIVHGRTLVPRLTSPAKATAKAAKAAPMKAAKAARAKPNGKASFATATPVAFAVGPAIVGAITAARCALSPKDIIQVTKLPRWRVMRTLLDMHASGQLVKVGKNRGARYALPSTPRPGAAAGTSAAPPVGPPSANGHTPSNGRRDQASGDFDVAWNGTKERNGQAPSILPPRERRA